MPINKGYLTAKTDKAADEVYTPAYAVIPIIKYIKPNSIVWCPFDTENSEFVKCIREAGYEVIATHIDNNQNFFDYEPEEYDVIISNPPYSIKDMILQRLNELNKPYAMLMPLPTLQGQARFKYLQGSQALIFDKRINFFKDYETKQIQKGISFATIYICKDFLPNGLIFEELEVAV